VPHGGVVTMEMGRSTDLPSPSTEGRVGTLGEVITTSGYHRPACRGGLLTERRASRGPRASLYAHGMLVRGLG